MRVDAGLNSVADFAAVPAAVYELMISGPTKVIAIEGKERDIGGQAYSFEFPTTIASGKYQGKDLRNVKVNSSKGARYFLLAMVRGLGAEVGEDGGFETDDIFQGLRFNAFVSIRKVKDDEKSTIESPVFREFNEIDVETIQKLA